MPVPSRGPLVPNDEILDRHRWPKARWLAPVERLAGRPDRDQIKKSSKGVLDNRQWLVIMTVMSVWTPLISAAASLGGALVGAFVGGWLSDRRKQKKRSADLIVRQLQEFYGPLTALRAETHLYDDLITRMNSGAPDLLPEQMPISGDDLTIMKDKLFPIYQRMNSWEKSLHSAIPAHAWIVRGPNDEVLQQRFHDKLLADYKAM
jgi:hypothetical protein